MKLLLLLMIASLLPHFAEAARLPNQVFIYELGSITPEEQARAVSKSGFDGTVFDGAVHIPERLAAVDSQHIQLFYIWLTVDVSNRSLAYEPGLESAIRELSGRSAVVWLAVKGSGPGAEERAVTAVRHVSDLAVSSGLRVALYPHYGFFLSRLEDVLRVADAAHRSNVGVTLNLCHELRAGLPDNLSALIERAIPRLYAVTINGADRRGHDWRTLIQPLGEGDFDVAGITQDGSGCRVSRTHRHPVLRHRRIHRDFTSALQKGLGLAGRQAIELSSFENLD